MVKLVTEESISSAIDEAKKRTAKLEQMQQEYDELKAAIGAADVTDVIDEFDVKIDDINSDIALLARHKIDALTSMSDYIIALATMGERHEAGRMLRRPIPGRRPRSQDVVTGKIYDNPTVACSVEGIKYNFRTNPPAGAWVRVKGYPLRDVK